MPSLLAVMGSRDAVAEEFCARSKAVNLTVWPGKGDRLEMELRILLQ